MQAGLWYMKGALYSGCVGVLNVHVPEGLESETFRVKEHLVCGNILCEGVYSVKEQLVCVGIFCVQ